ncbi:MAG: GTP cyclohydrolase I [Alphaproteobacteria bacterium]|nr:GTP cyclohydrolase I [Alphaproteobacteria bacterium]
MIETKDIEILSKPTDEEAKSAVLVLLRWIGEDLSRGGLDKTPDRVLRNYKDFFSGYGKNLSEILKGRFEISNNSDDIILLKKIKFTSFCEHHVLPIEGFVNIAYIPTQGIIGFDRVSQLVDAVTKKLQLQECITEQIAEALEQYVAPDGVAVSVSAYHQCMSLVGSKKDNVEVYTERMTGIFKANQDMYNKFLSMTLENEKGGSNEI